MRLVRVTNTGAAFGMLQGQTFFLTVTNASSVSAPSFCIIYTRPWIIAILRIALGLQLAGAIGNPSRPTARRRSDRFHPVAALAGLQRRRLLDYGRRGRHRRLPHPQRHDMAEERDLTEQSSRLAVQGEDGKRLDVFIAARCPGISRSQARRLIDEGLATVNRRPARASHLVRAGDMIDVRVSPSEAPAPRPEAIPLRILYEDGDILVVDKPAGQNCPSLRRPDRPYPGECLACPLHRPRGRRRASSGPASFIAWTRTPPACSSSPRTTAPTPACRGN